MLQYKTYPIFCKVHVIDNVTDGDIYGTKIL